MRTMTEGAAKGGRVDALLQAALALTAEHDLDHILDRMVACAADVGEARYAALGVYDSTGRIERFVHVGLGAETVGLIGSLPDGRGLLGEVIVADGPIRIADLTADPRSVGFPPGHPPMPTFLGVPIRVGNRRFGNLYLSEKRNGAAFDEEDERLMVTLAAFAACAIEGILLVSAEHDRTEVVAELAATRERERTQREMLGRVIHAQEAERARISRDLHDSIGQALTSVLLGLRLISGPLGDDSPEASDARSNIEEVRALVTDALHEVRQLAFDLRPTVLDDIGLVAALRRQSTDLARRVGVRIALELDGLDDDRRLPPEVETVVYRVVQEALTNVVRHAAASVATVTITVDIARVKATIVDDGVGFTLDAETMTSLGLSGMAERASLAGGCLDIVTEANQGTSVTLTVPR